MKDRFLQAFQARLNELGIKTDLPPRGDLIKWTITTRKRVKRHRAAAFRLSDRTAYALRDLSAKTGASKTEIIEKLILCASILMQCPEWDEVDTAIYREKRDTLTVSTVAILPGATIRDRSQEPGSEIDPGSEP